MMTVEDITIEEYKPEEQKCSEQGLGIRKDCVATIHYRLSDSTGELESSHEGDPMAYLHGHHNIIVGLEKALTGKVAGDKFTVEIPPAEAYGQVIEGSQQRVSIKQLILANKKKLKKGQIVSLQTEHGPRQVTIVKVGRYVVDVNTNHPLAGKTLTFDIEVVSVRAAEPEEIAHGHAHGIGGHHH